MSTSCIRGRSATPSGHHRLRSIAAALCAIAFASPGLAELDYPDKGVQIGQGWDSQQVAATGANCLHTIVGESQLGQESTLTLSEVTDKEQLSRAINASAEFRVKSLTGASFSGKSSFARQLQMSSTWSSFAVRAFVDNGMSVAWPPPPPGSAAANEYRAILADPKNTETAAGFVDALRRSLNLTPAAVGKEVIRKFPSAATGSIAERKRALTFEAVNGGLLRKQGMAGPARPAVASVGRDSDDPMRDYPNAIVLRKEYRDLAKSDPVQFRKVCGDSFVNGIRHGAEIDGLVTFLTASKSEQTAISIAAKGSSGFGFAGSGAFAEKMKSYAAKSALQIRFYQTGGRGDALPTSQAALDTAVASLPTSAANAPYRYSFTLQRYDEVANWPGNALGHGSGFAELALAYAKWDTLWQDISHILDSTSETGTTNEFLIGRSGGTRSELSAIQETARSNLKAIRDAASSCTGSSAVACPVPAGATASDMPFRAKLPLPLGVPGAPVEAFNSDADLKKMVEDYWMRRVNRGRCALDNVPEDFCLGETNLISYTAAIPVQARDLVFQASNKGCLSIESKNARLQNKVCDPSKAVPASHKWSYDTNKQAIYQMVDGKPYCFDVNGGDTRNNAAILSWPCHYGENQQFSIVPLSTGGGVKIIGAPSKRCVELGPEARLWDCGTDPAPSEVARHKWNMVLVAP